MARWDYGTDNSKITDETNKVILEVASFSKKFRNLVKTKI